MNSPNYIPSFYFYKFAQDLSAPYTSLEAYKSGAIDVNGNIIKPESSIDPLEYLVIKLKKIFAELPPGTTKAKLGNYMSTMQLFGEEAKTLGITDTEYKGLIEGYLALNVSPDLSYIELSEDMGAAGMATAATSPDYNTGSVSGFDPRMGTTARREPVLKGLDTCEMFDVCPEEMRGFKSAKAWKHVPDSETKRYLQRYQRRNPKGHMAVRSIDPDSGKADIHWINLKPMSFMEEFALHDLNILNEDDSLTTGQKNLQKIGNAQYNAISHFLDNHVRNLHDHSDQDDIEIHVDGSSEPLKMQMGSVGAENSFRTQIKNTISSLHSQNNGKIKHPIQMSIKTKNGMLKASVPHVSAHGTPDITIEDLHVAKDPIKIDMKGSRGRWETESNKIAGGNKKPSMIPVSEFDTGKPDKNSFVVFHDDAGDIKYVDYANVPNVKKVLSKVYQKSGSRSRSGRFNMVGEVLLRLSQRGIMKSVLRNMARKTTREGDIALADSAQKQFASKLAELTNTTFGQNDMYTSIFRKQK